MNGMKTIILEQDRHVATIRINRPDKRNALTTDMYAAMSEALKAGESDPKTRVHMIRGSDDCFTAGNDLGDFEDNPPTGPESPILQFLYTISALTKPLVAAVTGPAVGIGTTMLLHCDLVFAGESSRFQLPFARLGLCPEAASSVLLPALAGTRVAAELLLLGERFRPDRARAIGLVNEVCADDEVFDRAIARARQVASLPPASVRLSKSLLRQSMAATVREAIERESAAFIERLASPEAREALSAFREKRQPDFSRFD